MTLFTFDTYDNCVSIQLNSLYYPKMDIHNTSHHIKICKWLSKKRNEMQM